MLRIKHLFLILLLVSGLSCLTDCEKNINYKPHTVDGPFTFTITNNSSFDLQEFSVYYNKYLADDNLQIEKYLNKDGFYEYKMLGVDIKNIDEIDKAIENEYYRQLNSEAFKQKKNDTIDKYTDEAAIKTAKDSLTELFENMPGTLEFKIDSAKYANTDTSAISAGIAALEKSIENTIKKTAKEIVFADSVITNNLETPVIWAQKKFVFTKENKIENITSPVKYVKFAFRKELEGQLFITPNFFKGDSSKTTNIEITDKTFVVSENQDTLTLGNLLNMIENNSNVEILKDLDIEEQINFLETYFKSKK